MTHGRCGQDHSTSTRYYSGDYCNSILHHVGTIHVQPLQNVFNTAARVILWKRKFDHITDDQMN